MSLWHAYLLYLIWCSFPSSVKGTRNNIDKAAHVNHIVTERVRRWVFAVDLHEHVYSFNTCTASSVWLILLYTGEIEACFLIISHGARLLMCHNRMSKLCRTTTKKRDSIVLESNHTIAPSVSVLTTQLAWVYFNQWISALISLLL